uniref:BACK domain-containing protein n=1 Tax=Glossina austeni TaxID=7395 RepID=A0A1A9V6G9_GLOAU
MLLIRIFYAYLADAKVEEEVTGQYTGETVRSDALQEETEESEACEASEPTCTDELTDECESGLTYKSSDSSPKTSSKGSLTNSIHTGENKEEIKAAAPLKEREKWTSKTWPFKLGSMKPEGEEKIWFKCPSICFSKCLRLLQVCIDIENKFLWEFRHNGACLTHEMREDVGRMKEKPICTKQSLVCLTEKKEVRTRRRVCGTFSQNFKRRIRLNWISYILYLDNNFSLSSCLDNIKEAGRYALNRKEIKVATLCPCKFNSSYMLRMNMYLINKVTRDQIGEPKIPRTSATTSVYPRDANEIKITEHEVPRRKNMPFICVPDVKAGTIKRWLWKVVYNRAGDTRDDVSVRTCKDVNAFNAKANFGRRWVCEGFNGLAVGPSMYPFYKSILRLQIFDDVTNDHFLECACGVKKDAGYALTNEIREIPIRKNKSFVCVPEIAADGTERWTYKNMNASSYSWSSGRTQGGGGLQWISSDSNLASKSSTCKCSKCASNPKILPNEDDVRGDMFSDAIRKGAKFGNVAIFCGKEYNPFGKYWDAFQYKSREHKDDNVTAKLTDVCDPFSSDKEENTNEMTKVPDACTMASGVPCIKEGATRFIIFAAAYKSTDLYDRCDDYIYRNFLEVIDTDEYGLLCFEEVKELLSSNEIVTDTEVSVFDGVINWIKHCPSERLPLLLPLMNCVRLPIMSAKCLMTSVATEPYIKDNPECKDLLLDAMKYHLEPEKRYLMISEHTRERKPSKMISHVILAGANCSEGRMYDKNFTNCVCLARMKQRRCQAGVTSWHNLLYVVGGKDQSNSLKTAECYNPLTNAWISIPSMAAKHCNFGICSMYGVIYACGGHDGCSIHNYVECYDTLTSKWISCPAMKCSLDNTHASALDNCIYCVGTIGGLTNFERFDLREGIWCKMPSLLNYRKHSDMVSYGNYLFCMGGLSLDNCAQNTGERFDIRSNKWEHISSMPSARYGHSMVEIDGNVYVIGGDHLTVDYYNIGLNEWVQLESASIKHSFGGAAIVNCFPLK